MLTPRHSDRFFSPELQTVLTGTIERITYQNAENDYVVAQLRLEIPTKDLVTIVGTLPAAFEGERLQVEGEWQKHLKFGEQFRVQKILTLPPVTLNGLRLYLGSGLIRGIGPVYADKIVAKFGLATLKILDEQPQRLCEVDGIGDKRSELIRSAWRSQQEIKEIMMFLAEHGVSSTYALTVYKEYGKSTLTVLRQNPYQLAEDIYGIGFLTADKIAKNLGVADDEPARIEAGIKYTLNQAAEQGHLFLPREELVRTSSELLHVTAVQLEEVCRVLCQVSHLIEEEGAIYLPAFYHAEKGLAERLLQMQNAPTPAIGGTKALQESHFLFGGQKLDYNRQQQAALRAVLSKKLLIITGGPGTGKTTLVNGIIRIFENLGQMVQLCAPTGRAAKRLTETTGHKAQTIHRLLEYEPQEHAFKHDSRQPLRLDVLIVDEMSMVDCTLAYHLVQALPLAARLILVGDVDQLPSVGAGNVLRDLIDSNFITTIQLTEIFRQAHDSQIIVNAHQINSGLLPDLTRKGEGEKQASKIKPGRLLPRQDYGDFLFVQEEEPEKIVGMIQELCQIKLPQRYGYRSLQDIQILTPMYRGALGADNLNQVLQETLNPGKPALKRSQFELRVGDRVMQIRNNYDRRVFNGDLGFIRNVDREEQKLTVAFDKVVSYDFSDLDELVLAYAITVHKSQGSEHPVVIMPLVTQHYIMLQRNLLYTAVTRAKELLILLGTKKALALAVKNNQVVQRYTRLHQRLNVTSRP